MLLLCLHVYFLHEYRFVEITLLHGVFADDDGHIDAGIAWQEVATTPTMQHAKASIMLKLCHAHAWKTAEGRGRSLGISL